MSCMCGTDVLWVGTLMLTPASPRRSPAPARTASPTGRAGAASLPWCAASPASRSCDPATPSMLPPGSRGTTVEPEHLLQRPGCIARARRGGLHEGLDQHRVDQKNRVLSLSDDDGRAAAYRLDRTVTVVDLVDSWTNPAPSLSVPTTVTQGSSSPLDGLCIATTTWKTRTAVQPSSPPG